MNGLDNPVYLWGLIALSMLMKGWPMKLGCVGAVLFLLAIAPFGVGSGFPCTLIFAAGLIVLFRKSNEYMWKQNNAVIAHYKGST